MIRRTPTFSESQALSFVIRSQRCETTTPKQVATVAATDHCDVQAHPGSWQEMEGAAGAKRTQARQSESQQSPSTLKKARARSSYYKTVISSKGTLSTKPYLTAINREALVRWQQLHVMFLAKP
jgi:hypothetical protein